MNAFAVSQQRKGRAAIWLWLLVACGLAFVVVANAHLVYVAVTSQPECVSHLRRDETGHTTGPYRAAQSSCSPPATSVSAEGHEQ
ncbi:hypothetical protein OWC48_15810 [Bradyrhizobium sp. Arg816]|nr:hypothetical protein [Bradyrhizobium sp. Arg816]